MDAPSSQAVLIRFISDWTYIRAHSLRAPVCYVRERTYAVNPSLHAGMRSFHIDESALVADRARHPHVKVAVPLDWSDQHPCTMRIHRLLLFHRWPHVPRAAARTATGKPAWDRLLAGSPLAASGSVRG